MVGMNVVGGQLAAPFGVVGELLSAMDRWLVIRHPPAPLRALESKALGITPLIGAATAYHVF